ncbi:NADP-dependent oxidoreductase [Motiliproteus sp. MSK22-1]|uniref:NADP-dependent oxidoreductase n=1 Tax=Motiliproteus sp. MSK22-1 TaxID=1897630 RepID=UPI0009768250|nr:NADP-dependent oxidoreductase [Motiliproteus sp. MSK22-1]OMH31737.1 NADP-dependent oxidoreductase [Motiliproteus sp. MSK22-1]
MTYQAIILDQYPSAQIDEKTFSTQSLEKPALKDGEFLVKVTHLSLDPAMRGWVSPDPNSYIPPVAIGEVMRSLGYGEVIESLHNEYPVGTKVSGMTGWTELLKSSGEGLSPIDPSVSPEQALSVLGMPGLTAYLGYRDILDAKPGQTLVVTGAAGAVGSVVVQMAKADGLRVIGVAGHQDKCDWLSKDLGLDGVINYKTDNIAEQLNKMAPNGIDLFFENTGGETQQHVMERLNEFASIAVCGMIADYNRETPAPGPNWIPLIKRRAKVQGFTITDHFHRTPELVSGILPYLHKGRINSKVHILEGLESAKLGVNMLFTGENTGKLIVKL